MLSKADNLLRVLHHEEPAWIPVECLLEPRFGEGAYTFVTYQGALTSSEGGYDLWGVHWAPTAEFLPYPDRHPAQTLADALTLKFPDIHAPELWKIALHDVKKFRGESIIIARQVCALFERFWSLVGFENALTSLIEEPDLATAVLQRITDWQLAAADHFIELGVGAARISDDYGAQQNLLMSPQTWRGLIRPYLARLVERYQRADLPVILHSCGNLKMIMDDLIELGIAAFNIQTNANDLLAYRRRYGRRFCVWGGVSTQGVLATGTPAQVRELVQQAAKDLGARGGLILEPDQVIRIPEENLRAYYETSQENKYVHLSTENPRS